MRGSGLLVFSRIPLGFCLKKIEDTLEPYDAEA